MYEIIMQMTYFENIICIEFYFLETEHLIFKT